MEKLIDCLLSGKNTRENLSNLRKAIKDDEACDKAITLLAGHINTLCDFLTNEDAKTRKNAALLLGDLAFSETADILFETYLSENTMFVRSAYLKALSNMDIAHLVPQLKEQYNNISSTEVSSENEKHVGEELKALSDIIIAYEGANKHKTNLKDVKASVILTVNRNNRELVAGLIEGAKIHPLGVRVTTDNIPALFKLRAFREMLFPLNLKNPVSTDARAAAKELKASNMLEIIKKLHKGDGPFYYRVDCQSDSDYSRKISTALEVEFAGELINSPKDYELEIRLIKNRDKGYYPCLKFYTITDNRFDYRKDAISSSIHPSTAALIMELARPYLAQDAQIIDPFCGVGTMLIERDKAVTARQMYGIDIFGDAIEYARTNSNLAKARVNYIHRDFFDFKHDYSFDEIISNMPLRGKKSAEEMDVLYRDFFIKAKEILSKKAMLILYSNEGQLLLDNMSKHTEYSLIESKVILDKKDYNLYIISYEDTK